MVRKESNNELLESEKIMVPVEEEGMEVDLTEPQDMDTSVLKKPRIRKKRLFAEIKNQMEFYFGDANLRRDRFLGNLIKENPDVPLEVFLTFNKISALTDDVSIIAKSLESSSMLSVSEDGKTVRRVTPVKVKENPDLCTLYVENVPPDATHMWLQNVFTVYGKVEYVSIPRYKSNKKIKGFGFVEFETPESLAKCLQIFVNTFRLLPSSTRPSELLSVTTFNEGENDSEKDENNFEESEEVENAFFCQDMDLLLQNSSENFAKLDKNSSQEPKPSRETNETIASGSKSSQEPKPSQETNETIASGSKSSQEPKPSQERNETTESESDKTKTNTTGEKKKVKKRKLGEESQKEENQAECDELEKTSGKKTRKNKKKRKRYRYETKEFDGSAISRELGLRVMPKQDWKRLRNKYLQLQRDNMRQLKQHLAKSLRIKQAAQDKLKAEKDEMLAAAVPVIPPARFSYVPGVIVKVLLNEPCTNSRTLLDQLRANNGVKYVDATQGSDVAYVRCDSAENAQKLTETIGLTFEDRSSVILKDTEEKLYWEKMFKDREEKLGNKIRPKTRGRAKLLKKAEKELGKHIKFEEV